MEKRYKRIYEIQQAKRSFTISYYRRAQRMILLYDVTAEDTYDKLMICANDIGKNVESNLMICLVVNKIDLNEKKVINIEEGLKKTKEFCWSIQKLLLRVNLMSKLVLNFEVVIKKTYEEFKYILFINR